MNVPGIGPRTAKLLYEREGITGVDELDQRARAGGLRGLPGIQAKTEQNILNRFRAHSMADPELYPGEARDRRWRARDPIALFIAHLRETGLLADPDLAEITWLPAQ
jgi:hypothetical protein